MSDELIHNYINDNYKKYLIQNKKSDRYQIIKLNPSSGKLSYSKKNSNIILNLRKLCLDTLTTLAISTTSFTLSYWFIIPTFLKFLYDMEEVRKIDISEDEGSILWIVYLNDLTRFNLDDSFLNKVNKERKIFKRSELDLDSLFILSNSLVDKKLLYKVNGFKRKYGIIEEIEMSIKN